MVPVDQLVTALQAFITQVGGAQNSNTSPSGSASFNVGQFPNLPGFLPAYASEEFDGTGSTRDSQATIDLGPGGNAIILFARPNPNMVATVPQAAILVKDSATPAGPFNIGTGGSASIPNVQTNSPARYLVTGLQRYVKINVNVIAGGWIITWAATSQNVPGSQAQALYLSGTGSALNIGAGGSIGFAPPHSVAGGVGAAAGLAGGDGRSIFDARQAIVTIANIGTSQTITSATLQFTDTTANGVALTQNYQLLDASGNVPAIVSGTTACFIVPLNSVLYQYVNFLASFNAPPSVGSVDVLIEFQGPMAGPVSISATGLPSSIGAKFLSNGQLAPNGAAATAAVPRATRTGITFTNTGSVSVWIGAATVTTANGVLIPVGASRTVTWTGLIQMITAGGTGALDYWDERN